MKIVIAVCKKDLKLAEAQAKLIKKLGGLQAHSCLLVIAPEAVGEAGPLADILNSAFPRFERLALRGGVQEPTDRDAEMHPQPHVIPANQMFRATWTHLINSRNTEEVYWLEPDSVPLNNRWADELARDYLQANAFKKVFLGAFVPRTVIKKTADGFVLEFTSGQSYMMGAGIYPPNISQHSGLWAQAKLTPFDALMQWETTTKGMNTTKIVHNHATAKYKVVEPMVNGKAGVLSCEILNEWGVSTDKLTVPSDALVIHGCKDTSLIELVSSGKLFEAPKPKSDTPKTTTPPNPKPDA